MSKPKSKSMQPTPYGVSYAPCTSMRRPPDDAGPSGGPSAGDAPRVTEESAGPNHQLVDVFLVGCTACLAAVSYPVRCPCTHPAFACSVPCPWTSSWWVVCLVIGWLAWPWRGYRSRVRWSCLGVGSLVLSGSCVLLGTVATCPAPPLISSPLPLISLYCCVPWLLLYRDCTTTELQKLVDKAMMDTTNDKRSFIAGAYRRVGLGMLLHRLMCALGPFGAALAVAWFVMPVLRPNFQL